MHDVFQKRVDDSEIIFTIVTMEVFVHSHPISISQSSKAPATTYGNAQYFSELSAIQEKGRLKVSATLLFIEILSIRPHLLNLVITTCSHINDKAELKPSQCTILLRW